ncbi:MAG: hypothetical protein IJU48_09915 [Synergistaceae bacterium]|nr:hypothetical protein [Synergistaceae bacterium]
MMRRIFAAILAVMLIAGSAFALDVKAGNFTLKAPDSFVNGEVKDEERAEGLTAYYKSDDTLLDFDIYQLPKEEPFEEFVKSYSSRVTETEINGVKAAVYRSTDESEGQEYNTLNYILEDEKEYVIIVFWLDGDVEAEAEAIINSLSK